MQNRILILGSSGMLGQSLLPIFDNSEFYICSSEDSHSSKRADLTIPEQCFHYLSLHQPDIIINLIALTNVDRCEEEPNEAYRVNVKSVENIVSWIKKNRNHCHVIQVSTDQVYDGHGPHSENQIALKNYYAFSKFTAEMVAKQINSTIIRTNFFGKSKANNRVSFTDWLFNAIVDQRQLQVFQDVLFSPLSMESLNKIIVELCRQRIVGTFNIGSTQGISKADFAFKFANLLGVFNPNFLITKSEDSNQLKAIRPTDMRMAVEHFEEKFNIRLPTLDEEINKASKEYKL